MEQRQVIHDEDTLAYHRKERPGCLMRNLSSVPLKSAGVAAKDNYSSCTPRTPEDEALEFYFLNHAMADIEMRYEPDEPLGDALPIVHRYHQCLSEIGSNVFHYLLITTCREMRHLSGEQEETLTSDHGLDCVSFTKKVKSQSQSGLFEYTGALTVGPYLDYLCHVYDDLSWGSAYGGKAWGNVARCLRECVQGKTSIEMMVDTAFTLAHNNGPIFNKGFQYKMYDTKALRMILDCQRAGQIPSLIKSGADFCSRIKTSHLKLVDDTEKQLGVSYQKWVDWDVVKALGSFGDYEYYQQKNIEQFTGTPSYDKAHKEVVAKIAAAKAKQLAKQLHDQKTKLEVMPGVFVKKEEKQR